MTVSEAQLEFGRTGAWCRSRMVLQRKQMTRYLAFSLRSQFELRQNSFDLEPPVHAVHVRLEHLPGDGVGRIAGARIRLRAAQLPQLVYAEHVGVVVVVVVPLDSQYITVLHSYRCCYYVDT